MSSILNSISLGLLVHKAPREKPIKEDSIIDLLQSSKVEFETCPKLKDKLENINTGFGKNNDLHYETKCKKPELKTPLYLENYLREFVTEEEKAAARHSLGLYNKGDIVAMSLLTAEDEPPSVLAWNEVVIKQMRKGNKFFAPYTSFTAVFDSVGINLEQRMVEVQNSILLQLQEIVKINSISKGNTISSLGDVRVFLKGFNNGENLYNTLEEMDKEILRFLQTGLIGTLK